MNESSAPIEQVTEQPQMPMGNGKLIYVAGPYRAKTDYQKRENIMHAQRVAIRLWELNWVVFCPHLNTLHFDWYSKLPSEVWLKGGLEFLRRSDAIFMLSTWRASEGAKRELEVAVELGKEIYYEC